MSIDDKVYHLIKLLLYVAKEEGVEVTPTKLQKIFFLLEKEKGVQLELDFKPWIFGPYSSKLQDYIDKLIELEEVDVEKEEIRDPVTCELIAYKMRYVLKTDFKPGDDEKEREVVAFFKEWVKKSKDEILNYVYSKYPEYGRYSMIRDKILK